jgi:DNA-binding CsgD family transcriptional regulator
MLGAVLVAGFFFDASSGTQVLPRAVSAHDKTVVERLLMAVKLGETSIERMSSRSLWVESARNFLELERVNRPQEHLEVLPSVQDGWSVAGTNLRGQGYLLAVGISSVVAPLPASLLRRWRRVAVHLSAAFCLREHMARGLAPGEGILAPDGRLLHATGSARLPAAREALRLAVRGIDAARSRHRQDPESSLQAWQAVVSGRWTLVEQHERDGKRFLLARVNELQAPGSKALSLRERQVLGLVSQGASNKEIGYRLGIGEPSVAGYLRRGKAKIGVYNRAELLRWWQSQAQGEG